MSARGWLPTTGDLRTPAELVRSARAPQGDANFQQTLTRITELWACKRLSKRTFVSDSDTDSEATHVFWIRYDASFSVEARDFIRDGDELYAVAKVEPKGLREEWLKVSVIYHKNLTGDELSVDGVVTLNPGSSSAPREPEPDGQAGNDFFFTTS